MPSLSPQGGRLFTRQIPTIFGLVILIVALGAGVLFFNEGFKGFAPRAAPETTPKNVKISNISDTGFTVSFLTDEPTTGFVKYGKSAEDISSQAGDERDQLSGSVGEYTLHYVSVRGLDPSTPYYFTLGTAGTPEFKEGEAPYTLTTSVPNTENTSAKTIYGNVVNAAGAPAEGSVVYVKTTNSTELSALVKSSGSWAVPLIGAQTADGTGTVSFIDETVLDIMVQGLTPELTAQTQVTVATAQPVPSLTLGGQGDSALQSSEVLVSPEASPVLLTDEPLITASNSAALDTLIAGQTAEQAIVDLSEMTTPQTVTTTQPVIVGQAAPNVTITVEIHSDTQITQQVQSDNDGVFSVDVANLQQNLEPGEHSVTYSYVDPVSGQNVTKTQTFMVAAPNGASSASTGGSGTSGSSSTLLAQANTTPTPAPFGSGNPFPASAVPTPTPTPTPTLSPTPRPASGSATSSTSATRAATTSGRTSQPATGSGIPVSGSISTTLALIGGGIFFVLAGAWSFWVAQNLHSNRENE